MEHRRTALKKWAVLAPLSGFCALVMGALLLAGGLGAADTPQGRIPFQIATGATTGAFFPVGEAIAGLLSHPAGVDRCSRAGVCGPAGLIITARTSEGSVDNVNAVNSGAADSALARADVVAAAVRGEGVFRRNKAAHVRVIASLFSEDVHLLVPAKSKIKSVADLKGRRVSIGPVGSGVDLTARAILAAYGVPENRVKLSGGDLFDTVQQLQAGKLDAIFAVGGVPLQQLTTLLANGKARLVPIDGRARDKLVKTVPGLDAASIPANIYLGQNETQTVSTRAVWIVRDSEPDALVYGITRALFALANRDGLAESHPSAHEIGLAAAAVNVPAPLHPGALRYYKEVAAPR